MRKQSTYKKHKISFKRWKRTSWAVFVSLKIVVHNCCTRISSFKGSLLKQQGIDRSELFRLSIDTDSISEFEDVGIPWEEELLLEYSLPKTTATKVTKEISQILLSNCYILSLSTKFSTSVGIFYEPTI